MEDQNHEPSGGNKDRQNSLPGLKIRLMQDQDVDPCLEIFRTHGLVESAHGLRTYRTLCPGGCFVAADQETGEVIAMCVGTTFDPRVAVIGFYGVKPGFQGKGIGKKVWNEVISFLGPDQNISLYSSPAETAMYKNKAGFVIEDGVQMLVYESHGSAINQIAPAGDETLEIQVLPTTDFMDDVISFDASLIGVSRKDLLRLSLKEPETISFVAVDPRSMKVLGYGAMRQTNYTDGRTMLAPLYAISYTVAKILLYNLMINYPNSMEKGFFAFVLSSNPEAERLVTAAGLTSHFGAPRLFTKESVTGIDESQIFGLLSPDVSPY